MCFEVELSEKERVWAFRVWGLEIPVGEFSVGDISVLSNILLGKGCWSKARRIQPSPQGFRSSVEGLGVYEDDTRLVLGLGFRV